MTREVAIKWLKDYIQNTPFQMEQYERAFEMAIQALSQEPTTTTNNDEPITIIYPTIVCNDAVSREAVIEWLKDKDIIKLKSQEDKARKELKSLPPVTQKSGKWIELPKALNPNENPCECSECGHVLSFMNCYPKSKYCPNCGARMESEE